METAETVIDTRSVKLGKSCPTTTMCTYQFSHIQDVPELAIILQLLRLKNWITLRY